MTDRLVWHALARSGLGGRLPVASNKPSGVATLSNCPVTCGLCLQRPMDH
jgi:hypothetical protein